MGKVRVFISWSGERSKHVASALNDWIHDVIQNTQPFFSAEDIGAGTKWFEVVGKALEQSDFAILCITKANAKSPWVNFEAGACSKRFDKSRVVPYLIEGEKTDYEPPLTMFQCVKADEQGTFELIREINKAQEEPFDSHMIERVFKNNWPHLQELLARIPLDVGTPEPSRKPEEMFAEILSHLRDIGSKVTVPRMRTPLADALLHPMKADHRIGIVIRETRRIERELQKLNELIESSPEPKPKEALQERAELQMRLKQLTAMSYVLPWNQSVMQEIMGGQFELPIFDAIPEKVKMPEES